jgi:hypothetical protein
MGGGGAVPPVKKVLVINECNHIGLGFIFTYLNFDESHASVSSHVFNGCNMAPLLLAYFLSLPM